MGIRSRRPVTGHCTIFSQTGRRRGRRPRPVSRAGRVDLETCSDSS
jgi:hypothetical protein